MIVELCADLFAGYSSLLDLAALISLCREDPHCLLLDPPYDPEAPPPGLDAFGELQGEVALALEYGPDAAAQRPRNCPRIKVVARGAPDWTASPPRLPVTDALRLLRRPLDVVLENRRNDGAFLRKMLPPQWRRDFERWEKNGAVRIDSEGGMGEMKKRVERAAGNPEEAARLWLLFDRDCRGEDPAACPERDAKDELRAICKPSDSAMKLKEACERVATPWPLSFWMLERRTIENYLPRSALFGWAGSDRERRALVEAFEELSRVFEPGLSTESQRSRQRARCYCFPMKDGLLGDVMDERERKRLHQDEAARLEDAHLSPLYRPLGHDLRQRLKRGFGKQIASLFQDGHGVERVQEVDLAREVDQDERIAMAVSIAGRV